MEQINYYLADFSVTPSEAVEERIPKPSHCELLIASGLILVVAEFYCSPTKSGVASESFWETPFIGFLRVHYSFMHLKLQSSENFSEWCKLKKCELWIDWISRLGGCC